MSEWTRFEKIGRMVGCLQAARRRGDYLTVATLERKLGVGS